MIGDKVLKANKNYRQAHDSFSLRVYIRIIYNF